MKISRVKKYSVLFSIFFFVVSGIFGFEWPISMDDSKETQVRVNFAEERVDNFSSGFVFSSGEQDITACDDGKVLVYINPADSYFEKFSSPLGQSVIACHPDGILSVYANLSSVETAALDGDAIARGEVIAKVKPENSGKDEGFSGFHLKNETLEFHLIDTKNKVAINPCLLLPPKEKVFTIFPGIIYLVNKRNAVFKSDEKRALSAGSYSLYRDYSYGHMPLKTSISVNGVDEYSISYDQLVSKSGALYVLGKTGLNFEGIFGIDKKQFLGDVVLVRGKNLVTLTITDYNKIDRKISYLIEAY